MIIDKYQNLDKRIRIINHHQNLGVYSSRIDAVLKAKGEYILLMDPDDMLLNPYLFKDLYNFNKKLNIDIIEFGVCHQKNGKLKIKLPKNHSLNHFHNFSNNIIYQPELSDVIFYIPRTKTINAVNCRTIWNKLIKKNIMLQTIKYIETVYSNQYLIAADDIALNIISFNFANNYTNLNLKGYLYIIRRNSITKKKNGYKNAIIGYNYLLYFKLFYKYSKEFNKNLNYFFYELKLNHKYLSFLFNFIKII